MYYDPQSAGINVQSPQSESTPRRLTLKEANLSLLLLNKKPGLLRLGSENKQTRNFAKFSIFLTEFFQISVTHSNFVSPEPNLEGYEICMYLHTSV